jgi:type I restriction enzyme S subunit
MSKQQRQELVDFNAPKKESGGASLVSFADVTAPKVEQGGPAGKAQFVYIDISSVDNKLKRITEPKTLEVAAAPSRAKQRLQAGDVLVSMTRPNLNAVAMMPPELDGAVGSTGFHVLRANEGTEPRWLYYAVQTHHFVSAMSELVQGALYPAVRPKDIRAFGIPHPPLDQQKRIVAELEKQFSRLDEAVANLKRVKANLKRYKAAVLKAAVEGRLVETEAELARREGRSYETGEQLLQRILETRRSQWKGKGKYKEPAAPDTSDLPELPEGWVWATYEQVGHLQLGRQRAPKYHTGQNMHPYLRVQNVFEDRIDLSDVMEMDFPANDYEKYRLEAGDLLLNEGQSPELLGRPAIYRGELAGACFTNTLIRFRAVEGISVEFALLVSRHNMHAGRFVDEGTITTNIAHLSVGRLATVEFPSPPTTEQHRIVAEVDRRLSLLRETEAQVDTNLRRAERLRQSILSRAFSGGLTVSKDA